MAQPDNNLAPYHTDWLNIGIRGRGEVVLKPMHIHEAESDTYSRGRVRRRFARPRPTRDQKAESEGGGQSEGKAEMIIFIKNIYIRIPTTLSCNIQK
jgi:hypothetical protein